MATSPDSEYRVRLLVPVVAYDASGSEVTEYVEIKVVDANEMPSFDPISAVIPEDAETGYVVVDDSESYASSGDAFADQSLTFTLESGGHDDYFHVVLQEQKWKVVLSRAGAEALDYETMRGKTISVGISTTDNGYPRLSTKSILSCLDEKLVMPLQVRGKNCRFSLVGPLVGLMVGPLVNMWPPW
jgi:hypothetical protein